MRLELNTSHLNISFSCDDENHDHLELLEDIKSLITKLSSHDNVKLLISSRHLDYPDIPAEDIHPMEQ